MLNNFLRNKVYVEQIRKNQICKHYEQIQILKKIREKQEEIYKQLSEFNSKNKPFLLKSTYESIIPLTIYTCWHSTDLPPFMNKNVEYLKQSNPEFDVKVYDEEMCRKFIENNFDEDVLNSYNSLKPCSYKSDLWRFCVLYINGGIYIDIKYRCINNFKLIALTEKEHFVKDREHYGTYTALIVTLPKNQIMFECIQRIVENVKNKYYGNNALDPTGPGLLGSFFSKEETQRMEMHFECTNIENYYDNIFYIMYNDNIIMTVYKEYRDEQNIFQKYDKYGTLWDNNDIYF